MGYAVSAVATIAALLVGSAGERSETAAPSFRGGPAIATTSVSLAKTEPGREQDLHRDKQAGLQAHAQAEGARRSANRDADSATSGVSEIDRYVLLAAAVGVIGFVVTRRRGRF